MLGGLFLLACFLLIVPQRALGPVLDAFTRACVVCAFCAKRETRTKLGPVVLRQVPDPWSAEAWWARVVPVDHEHEWHPVGCIATGRGFLCIVFTEHETFLGTLPRFRDQVLAREIALELCALTPEERWKELCGSTTLSWMSALLVPERPPEPSLESQQEAYERWLDEHPRWRDTLPASVLDRPAYSRQ